MRDAGDESEAVFWTGPAVVLMAVLGLYGLAALETELSRTAPRQSPIALNAEELATKPMAKKVARVFPTVQQRVAPAAQTTMIPIPRFRPDVGATDSS